MSSFSSSTPRRLWLLLTAIIAGLIGIVVLLAVIPATASHLNAGPPTTTHNVQPTQVDGNPTCSSLLNPGDSLFEFKFEPVADAVIPLSFNGTNFTLTVDQYNTPGGQAFDFSFSNGFGVSGVFVKAGPAGNFYDYRPDGVTSDTFLHGPINPKNGRFYGLSHISFCIVQLETELEIVKTAVDDEITVGESPQFDITVTNTGTSTAENVTIDDELPAAGSPWTDNSADCDITGGTTLHCDVGDLAPSASFTVRVTGAAMTSDDCGEVLNNTAFADADNAAQVDDDASITVVCGAIEVSKVVKVPGTAGTQPLAGAGFELYDSTGTTLVAGESFTDASGIVCFDGLRVNTDYLLVESSAPSGYSGAADQTVTTGATHSDCGDGNEVSVTVENTPLTDLRIDVAAQVPGATNSSIDCGTIGSAPLGDPVFLDVDDLEPGTYVCTIVIDP